MKAAKGERVYWQKVGNAEGKKNSLRHLLQGMHISNVGAAAGCDLSILLLVEGARLIEIHWPSGRLVLRVTQDLSTSIRAGMLFEGHFQMWAGAVFTVIAHPPGAVAHHQGVVQCLSGRMKRKCHDSTVTAT
ncbi:hypothetical protein EMIT0P258_90155 [Pseudomonas sp. IT-P258]